MAATSSKVSGAKYMTITAGAMAITGLSMTDLKRRLVARLQTHRKFTENSRISQCLEICRQITSSFFPSYSVHTSAFGTFKATLWLPCKLHPSMEAKDAYASL